jgi:phosphatidate cytidylyltransferase
LKENMLKQRVITAIVLLLVLLPALFYPSPEPFSLVALVLITLGAWEWARLNGFSGPLAYVTGAVCMALCLVAWWYGLLTQPFALPGIWIFAGAFWVLAGAWLLKAGVGQWSKIEPLVRLVIGVLLLALAWLAVCQARVVGIEFLLSILILVWVADIFAYFAGRTFGGRFSKGKLAPSISPGKSWEGVWGGMLGVLVLAILWNVVSNSFESTGQNIFTSFAGRGLWFLLLAVLFLAAMSVVGDLLESLVKRSAGVKDSSGLLPGHGGVLDRLDALLPTVPLAMMLHVM